MNVRRTVVELDNRDQSETWLWLEDGSRVEVDPIELFENLLENMPIEVADEIIERVLTFRSQCQTIEP